MEKYNELKLIHSALTHFVGEMVLDVSKSDDFLLFATTTGKQGFVEPSLDGWHVWMDDHIVYVIEFDLFEVIHAETDYRTLHEYIKTIDKNLLSYTSKTFLELIETSLVKLMNAPISPFRYLLINDSMISICLN
jgi:hypothetical protein